VLDEREVAVPRKRMPLPSLTPPWAGRDPGYKAFQTPINKKIPIN